MNNSVRLVHISDPHVAVRHCRWRRQDWLSKRLAAWMNLRLLGRGFRFRHNDRVLPALLDELRRQPPDCVVFSGDATALGFEEEVVRACEMLGVSSPDPLPGLAVPGNHDYCTRLAADGTFEKHFAPWQEGLRLDGAVYPFARKVGHVWLIGVNSSTANRWAWDASGAVGVEQLDRLRRLLEQLDPGPRILVTHYPVCLASGKPENHTHRLRDLQAVAQVALAGGVGLWLHGHRHDAYRHAVTELTPFPVVCAGSSTQTGLWSHGDYRITGHHLRGTRRVFDPGSGAFVAVETFELDLPG